MVKLSRDCKLEDPRENDKKKCFLSSQKKKKVFSF